MVKKFTTALFVLLMISCNHQAPEKETTKPIQHIDGWKLLDEKPYSMQYPADWELNQSGKMGETFIIFAPFDSEQDNFRENVNLLVQDLSDGNMDLDAYVKLSENQVKTMIPNSVIAESKRIKHEDAEYHKIVYTGDHGSFNLKYMQYYWIVNAHAVILTFTAEQSQYSRYLPTAEKMLNAFIMK